jgi:putative two-component system response regulator
MAPVVLDSPFSGECDDRDLHRNAPWTRCRVFPGTYGVEIKEMIEERKFRLLLVDDIKANVKLLRKRLESQYEIEVALDGRSALDSVNAHGPDLILLDVQMPDMDGYEVCEKLKNNGRTASIPVIFLTSKGEVQDETKGLALGAVDYITKPFSFPIVEARVKTHLALKAAREALEDQNRILEQKVRDRTRELALAQEVTIHSLASLAEARDNETGGHLLRTQRYVHSLARRLSSKKRFRAFMEDRIVELLCKSAPLHDIGKVGVPDRILLKPGKLTDEEFEEMKKHTSCGRNAIMRAEEKLGRNANNSFLHMAREITYSHHEKWDGSGYPEGLKGESIPAPGRLMALADVYDALISKRVYKPAFPHEKAVEIILEGRETHFDPDVVDAFLQLQGEFKGIAECFSDNESDEEYGRDGL